MLLTYQVSRKDLYRQVLRDLLTIIPSTTKNPNPALNQLLHLRAVLVVVQPVNSKPKRIIGLNTSVIEGGYHLQYHLLFVHNSSDIRQFTSALPSQKYIDYGYISVYEGGLIIGGYTGRLRGDSWTLWDLRSVEDLWRKFAGEF
ncbi:unnamed protein product [Allacma fusca]|uniref:Uncharacterized protein n=1 Tax=Allacma fusca TaxID=39272 RepID=A0A8J2LQW2_9HEXA|nr:unnamed protein product [Allacma fusca]